jgi:hypothetical protein
MALLARRLDERELNQLRDLADRFALDRHDPTIAAALQHVDPAHPTAGDGALIALARDRIRAYTEYHRQVPFRVVPASVLQAGIVLAQQRANHVPITITTEQLTRHLLLAGGTGFGKTTLIRQVLRQLQTLGIKRFTIDRKDDTRRNAIDDPNCLILHAGARYNPLQKPAYLSLAEHLTLFVQCFARSFFGGEHLKQALTEALQRVFSEQSHPCLADVPPILERLLQKATTFTRRDALQGLLLRLQRFALVFPTPCTTRRGVATDELFRHSLHLPVSLQSEPDDFLFTLLVHHLFLYQRSRQARAGLEYVIVIDEALHLWQARASNIEHQPLLSMLQSMVREFGIGLIVATTSLQVIDPILKANVFAQIAMSMTNHFETSEVASSFGMTNEEHAYFSTKLQRGECIIKLADGWRYPLLGHFPPDHDSKEVREGEWREAQERINAIAPEETHPESLASREEVQDNRQPATAAPSPSASHASAAPLIKPIALNTHAETLLRHTARAGVALTTEAFRDLDLHPQAGTRAKKQLLDLALLEEERITIRRGRGGTGVAIRPSKSGYERAGVKRHGTRGGDSVQHEYLVRALAKRISGARIDARAGTKACDLLIPYNDEKHQQLATLLGITPRNGEFLAIEVEVSDPERTAPRNIARNDDAGITNTIIATMTPLRRTPPGAVVVDVFALLETL